MLVLSRKPQEVIHIGDGIKIVVARISSGRVSLAVEAPGLCIVRGELHSKCESETSSKDVYDPETSLHMAILR